MGFVKREFQKTEWDGCFYIEGDKPEPILFIDEIDKHMYMFIAIIRGRRVYERLPYYPTRPITMDD